MGTLNSTDFLAYTDNFYGAIPAQKIIYSQLLRTEFANPHYYIGAHPPLYSILLSFWTAIFRDDHLSPRILSLVFGILTLPILILSSLYVYRPFCQLICPFGLYAWLLENFAVNKITINEDKCKNCKECVNSCPTQAMKGIYEKRRAYFLPDCWACGKCIEVCPTDAIKYLQNKKAIN